MTAARSLLNRGVATIAVQFGEPFTIPGFNETFTGFGEGLRIGNELGVGGLLPEAHGTFRVPADAFTKQGVWLEPYPGMSIVVRGLSFIVTQVVIVQEFWELTLTISYPRESDVPEIFRVVGTWDGKPIEFTTGLVALNNA